MSFVLQLERQKLSGDRMELVLRRMQHAHQCLPEFQQRLRTFDGSVDSFCGGMILQTEGDKACHPRFLLSGWACRCRFLDDGRRQLFDLVLPGEGIGIGLPAGKLARTSTYALTAVQIVNADDLVGAQALHGSPDMQAVVQAMTDAGERRMLDQIVRLGCMSALERLANLLLDLHDRALVIGQAFGGRFPFFATQEVLSDLLGLSVVHMNRTIKELRRLKLVTLTRQACVVHDRRALERLACYPIGAHG